MKKSMNAVRKTYAPQQNSDINRRVVTKTMPAQNSTTTLPRILKQKPACQKCFVCDGDIETQGFPLIMASTLSSKTSLPNKIGKLMGDGFMVIVSMDDVICKRCSSLFNHMDRLETDLERVQNTLSGYLKVKYKISDDDIEKPPSKMIKLEQNDELDNLLLDGNNSSQEIETQLTNMFGSPIHITQKDDKNRVVKMYKCVACDFKTTDLTQFQPHYDKCPKKHKLKDSEHVGLKALEAQGAVAKVEIKKFVCNICNFKISDKVAYEEHMKKHVNLRPFKCRVCAQRFENREQATIHARTHQPEYFKCGLCNITYQKRDLLMKHLEQHDAAKANSTTVTTTASSTISTQRLLQASIEEALRDTANENESSAKAALENKPIEFYSCSTCSLTFLQESIYTQHMKQHRTDVNKKPTGQSLIRQEVRSTNATILNSQTPECGDLESIFEKMHSDKTETPVVVTTASSNPLEQVTFNITIPQDSEAMIDPEQQITANTIRKHENVLIFKCETCNEAYGDNDHLKVHYITSGHGPSHSPPMPIDMPNLDEPENGEAKEPKSEPDANSVDKPEITEANNAETVEKSTNLSPPEEDHRTESNTDPVPMEIEDMNSEQQESGEIKLMLDADNQLVTSDGQILQLDNHILTDADGNQIITSSDGQILTVQGADNEQLQQLLQSVGVVVQQQEEGEEEQMQMQLDGSQMIIVQTDSGEQVQMTLEQAQEAGIDLSQLMQEAKEDEEMAEGEEKNMAFNLDELCQLQEGETAEPAETITDEIESENK